MAILRGGPVDYQKNELRNARIQNLSSAPSSPVEGQIYYDTTLHEFGYYNGTTWIYSFTVPDADATTKGILKLTNDLGGTAALPTVVNLHLAGDTAINHKLTSVTDPTGAQDAATKNYVDVGVSASSAYVVDAVITQNLSVASPAAGPFTAIVINKNNGDTYTPNTGDRLWLAQQTTTTERGIWIYNGAGVAMTRATDWAVGQTKLRGVLVNVSGGVGTGGAVCYVTNGGVVGTYSPSILNTSLGNFNSATADLWLGTHKIVNLGDPTLAQDAATKNYVDTRTINTLAAQTADYSANSHKLTNVTDPTSAQDAATKNYVDGLITGVSWKKPVLAATSTALPTNTYSAGVITASANGALASSYLDNITPSAGNRILVLFEGGGTSLKNGIYTVTQVGDASHPFILTRDTDADTWAELTSATVMVEEGSLYADTIWTCTVDPGGTLGTTSITWVLIQSGMVIAGDNTYITRSGNTILPVGVAGDPTPPLSGQPASFTSVALARVIRFAITGTGTTFTLTHNLSNRVLQVQGYTDSSGTPSTPIELDWVPSSANAIVVTFPVSLGSSTSYYVVITG